MECLLQILKILSYLATTGLFVVAYMGLRSWQNQEHAKYQIQCIEEILVALNNYHELIRKFWFTLSMPSVFTSNIQTNRMNKVRDHAKNKNFYNDLISQTLKIREAESQIEFLLKKSQCFNFHSTDMLKSLYDNYFQIFRTLHGLKDIFDINYNQPNLESLIKEYLNIEPQSAYAALEQAESTTISTYKNVYAEILKIKKL